MAVTEFTLTGDLSELADQEVKGGTIEINVYDGPPQIAFPVEGEIRVPGGRWTIPQSGLIEKSLPHTDIAGANPSTFQYEVRITAFVTGGRKKKLDPIYVTAGVGTDTVDLAEALDTNAASPTWMTGATATLQAYVNEAQDLRDATQAIRDGIVGDLTTTDSQVATLATPGSGSELEGVLSATFDTRLGAWVPAPTGGAGTSASPWTHADGTGGIATAFAAARASGEREVVIKRGFYLITTAGTDILTGDRITFKSGARLRPSGLSSNANVLQALSRSDFQVRGSLFFDGSAQGSTAFRGLNFEGCSDYLADVKVRAKDGAGNPVRTINSSGDWVGPRVSRKTTETAGSAHFVQGCQGGMIGDTFCDGGDEALDLADCTDTIYGDVRGINCNEPLDIGSSTATQGGAVSGRNNAQGVNLKIDAGVNSTGTVRNYIKSIRLEEMQSNVTALTITNSAAGVPLEDNYVGSVVARPAAGATNVCGVRIVGYDDTWRAKRNRVAHYNFVGPGEGIILTGVTEGNHVGDKGSYVEATGNAPAILLSDSGALTFNHYDDIIEGTAYAPARSGAGNGAVQYMKAKGCDYLGRIKGSGADGFLLYKSIECNYRGRIRECGGAGFKHRAFNDANYSGAKRVNNTFRGTLKNCGKSTAEAAFRIVAETGTTDIRAIHMLPGSRVLDDQTTATTTAIDLGIADYCEISAHIDEKLVAIVSGTPAVMNRFKFTGRLTTGGSDDGRAAMAALNSDGAMYVRALVSSSAELAANCYTPVSASGGVRAMTLPATVRNGQRITVRKTDAVNNVTVTGHVAGVAATTITLTTQNETLSLVGSDSSWWPMSKGVV